ncbi:MAG: hypothetical protein H6595_07490 [Flavobacteriales bacterium]|nr:hypothetical protein [Flavobacteriales bacterium]MCB9167309.1 hypothetical protein [Flavobacteriales bacterium]
MTPRTALFIAPFLVIATQAQVVDVLPDRIIKAGKAEVTMVAVAPKGDRILVATDQGAGLYDIESGRKVQEFPYDEDGSTVVWYAAFNDNGEFVVLIGRTGKREVWDVKSGKTDKMLNKHRWIPDPRATKALGLDMSNSEFDRFYQQSTADNEGITAQAVKDGAVEFKDGEGKVLQRLEFPENRDQHHRAPCLFQDVWFITGTDDGRVLFYKVR